MVVKLKSKQEIRAEMEREIQSYLQDGGEIKSVDQGVSGRESNSNLNQTIAFTPGEFKTRTLVNDTIKNIDERKQQKKPASNTIPHKPKKRIIYDDFGEPIREVWE